MLPPSALTPMTRYRQPELPRRSGLQLVGRILLWLTGAIVMLAVALVAGIYLFFHQSVSAIRAHSADVKAAQRLLTVPPPGRAAIALVIGYDHRADWTAGTPSRSDTIMLLRADPTTKTISMLSIPRDLLVDVHCPGQPVYLGKINSAYATCGSKGTLDTVTNLIGLPINYLITVDFHGFKEIVDRLGGVWVDVDRRYFNNQGGPNGYATINLEPGYQLLTGGSALNFVRYRHTDSDLVRVARQQEFVQALKYQLVHNFSVFSIPRIVGALTRSIEVGVGGGGQLSGRTVLSYALFAYDLPPGHFVRVNIHGLTGYSNLTTSPSDIQSAVQRWMNPEPNAGKIANDVALGVKVHAKTPTPAQTTVSVLNGNGVLGAAGNASYLLSQRGYHVLSPPPGATGNAPRSNYYPTKVYWNPRIKRSKAAARALAKLFAPADTAPLPAVIRPLVAHPMVAVVVGTTFHGSITPTAPAETPVRQPAEVMANPFDTASLLRVVQPKVHFPLEVPTVVENSSAPDPLKPMYAYRMEGSTHGVRIVFRTAGNAYWGIQETNWGGAPILSDRSFRHTLGGRVFDFYYDGSKLHMVVLRHGNDSYWVVNSLLDDLSNTTMIAIAKGLHPLSGKK